MTTSMLTANNDLGGKRLLSQSSSSIPTPRRRSGLLASRHFSDSISSDPNQSTKSGSSSRSSEALWIVSCDEESNLSEVDSQEETNESLLAITTPPSMVASIADTNKCQILEEEKDEGFLDDDSITTVDTAERLKSAADDFEDDVPILPSQQASDGGIRVKPAAPSKPILKITMEEEIPVCTKPRSWRKMPVPDMESIRRYRERSCSLCEATSSSNKLPSSDVGERPRSEGDLRATTMTKGSVGFRSVIIREYQQTIGDNPSVSYGTPISLDWEYEQCAPLPLTLYEASRLGSKRSMRQLFLNHYQRKNLLIHKYGFSEAEVKAAKYETNRARSQRDKSKMMQISFRPLLVLEEARESAMRKVKRRLSSKSM